MIESTVSRGADVTSSSCPAMSTWQLGAKHSITKRSTRGPHREVRLPRMAHPRRVHEPRMVLSSLVARGLAGHFATGGPLTRSWLKIYGCECVNPSVAGRTPRSMATAPSRPRTRPRTPAAGRCRVRPAGLRGGAFGLAQQYPAGGGHGGQTEGRGGGAPDGRPVHDKDDRHEHAAEGGPSHDLAGGLGRGVRRALAGAGARFRRPARRPATPARRCRGTGGQRGGRRCGHGCSLRAAG